MNVIEEPSKIISVPRFVNLSYNSEYCCRIIPPAKEDKKDDHWFEPIDVFENDSIKLIPKLAWQEFSSAALKGVHQFGGTIRTFCQRAIRGGRISFLRVKFNCEFTLLDVNSLYPCALTHIRIPTTRPLVYQPKSDQHN
jgi:hypothetical protein